jgi:glyoxylate utilization-related uncharacterized protein
MVLFVPSGSSARLVCLNADPDQERGNYRICDGKAVVVVRDDLFAVRATDTLYLSHHATCPQADAWRKRKNKM